MSLKKTLKQKINHCRRLFLFGERCTEESYIRKLNRMGARIDESVKMSVPESVFLDETTPYMLEIGKNVFIAEGVKILTHDASWLVMKTEDGIIRGHIGPVKIGNNVFLGMNSMVMCNVSICDNVIIGANAVVNTSIHTPGVYAGNPAKMVATMEQMKMLRDSRQVKEAYTVARTYYERFGEKPPQEILNEYFWIFEKRILEKLPPAFLAQMGHCGNFQVTADQFMKSEPDFDGYEEFWSWCEKKIEKEKNRV